MSSRLAPRKLLFAAVGAATFAVACSSLDPPPVGNLVPPAPDGRIDAPGGAVIDALPTVDGPVANLMAPPDAPLSMVTVDGKLA